MAFNKSLHNFNPLSAQPWNIKAQKQSSLAIAAKRNQIKVQDTFLPKKMGKFV